jgi:hypothetical protein
MLGGKQVAEIQDARVKLTEQLVGQAPNAVLVLVSIDVIERLDKVFTVPKQLVEAATASLKGLMTTPGQLRVVHYLR